VVRLGWACGAFGLGVWCVWVGRVVRFGPVCGAFGLRWLLPGGSQPHRMGSADFVSGLIYTVREGA